MNIFENNPKDARLKTHKLRGKLNGSFAFSIDYNCRVVFNYIEGGKQILLLDIGTHDEVY